jgi:2-hydroxychromene-2-carboxylate isomerase
MTADREITFHFDFLSPYAYLAWTQIHSIALRHGREVRPIPTLLAPLLAEGGTKGPAEIPAKRVWVFKDTYRSAKVLGVPFAPPSAHPFNPLLALRTSSVPMPEPDRRRVIDAFYREAWGGGRRPLDDRDVVATVLRELDLDADTLIANATSDAGKARLKAQTEEAIRLGVFGVPTMFVDNELFFGLDSFGHLELRLQGKDPLDDDALEQWQHLGATAQRRQNGR